MVPDTPPTAEGELAQTPFAHLAVFALERRLDGELFLIEPGGTTHAIRFERGAPIKIKVGDEFARLGALLVEDGVVSAETVEGAAAMKGGLLGDLLVLSGYVEPAALEAALERQFRARMTRFFGLPAQTAFRYFEGAQTLQDYGGEPASLEPLDLICQGIREHGQASTLYQATLDLLGNAPLKLHPEAPLDRLDLCEDEALVVELLNLEPTTLAELETIEGCSQQVVRNFVYTMMLTRLLDLGKGLPVGLGDKPKSVAKVRLRSEVHRKGAALDERVQGQRSVRSLNVKGRAIVPRDEGESVPPPPVEVVQVPPAALGPEQASAEVPPPSSKRGVEAATARSSVPSITNEAGQAPAKAAEPAESAPHDAASTEAAAIVDEPSGGEESSRRLIADAVRGLSHEALVKLAREKIDEKDPSTAAEICALALARLEGDGQLDSDQAKEISLIGVWARSLEPHPDLKALTVELDDLIRERDDRALARLVRGRIRKKLGNDPGALSDYRRVLELEPDNAEAKAELASLDEAKPTRRGETGFLKRLFRR